MKITLFYVTFASEESASSLCNAAITNRLAACGNVFPTRSTYPWLSKIQDEKEFILVLKTIPELKENLQTYILQNHPYDVPAILSWKAEVNNSYGEWMKQNVK